MKRRQFIALLAGSLSASCQTTSQANADAMSDQPPEKIRLIPDRWHLPYVGRLKTGQLYYVESQLISLKGITRDFVCTYLFEPSGQINRHLIEAIGIRGSYPPGAVGQAISRHLSNLGERSVEDIWIQLFSIANEGTVFGFIPRKTSAGSWRVEAMPGNTLSFYPPWASGGYDT